MSVLNTYPLWYLGRYLHVLRIFQYCPPNHRLQLHPPNLSRRAMNCQSQAGQDALFRGLVTAKQSLTISRLGTAEMNRGPKSICRVVDVSHLAKFPESNRRPWLSGQSVDVCIFASSLSFMLQLGSFRLSAWPPWWVWVGLENAFRSRYVLLGVSGLL